MNTHTLDYKCKRWYGTFHKWGKWEYTRTSHSGGYIGGVRVNDIEVSRICEKCYKIETRTI